MKSCVFLEDRKGRMFSGGSLMQKKAAVAIFAIGIILASIAGLQYAYRVNILEETYLAEQFFSKECLISMLWMIAGIGIYSFKNNA